MNDFNPGILGLIIWGIISYLFRKKKVKNKSSDEALMQSESSNLEYFDNLFEDKENIGDENSPIIMDESFQSIDIPLEIEKENSDIIQSSDRLLDLEKNNESKIELLMMLKDKNSLKSAFIMKEILDKPVSLKNYD